MISVNCYYFCLKVLFFRLVLPFRSYACFPEDKTMYFIHLLLFTLSFENSLFFLPKSGENFFIARYKELYWGTLWHAASISGEASQQYSPFLVLKSMTCGGVFYWSPVDVTASERHHHSSYAGFFFSTKMKTDLHSKQTQNEPALHKTKS